MKWIWSGGRFSWPFMALLVFLTIALVIFDVIWRMFVIPFEALALYAALFVGTGITVLALAMLLSKRAGGD